MRDEFFIRYSRNMFNELAGSHRHSGAYGIGQEVRQLMNGCGLKLSWLMVRVRIWMQLETCLRRAVSSVTRER